MLVFRRFVLCVLTHNMVEAFFLPLFSPLLSSRCYLPMAVNFLNLWLFLEAWIIASLAGGLQPGVLLLPPLPVFSPHF